MNQIDTYLEIGQKRTFAGAADWPGWCRSGRDEESALQALLDYAPRYGRVLRATGLGFQAPRAVSSFVVIERLEGDATTDFGAPGRVPAADTRPVDWDELLRFQSILKACWQTFDACAETANGKTLRTGPRGGGRQLEGIIRHGLGADESYLSQVGWKLQKDNSMDLIQQILQTRQAILDASRASAGGEIPAKGPRGGIRWTARYFVRRVAWHALDHAWEIEDRSASD